MFSSVSLFLKEGKRPDTTNFSNYIKEYSLSVILISVITLCIFFISYRRERPKLKN